VRQQHKKNAQRGSTLKPTIETHDSTNTCLVTLWRRPSRSSNFTENTRRRRKTLSAEAIARLADVGKDVSQFLTNNGRMTGPVPRVNVDLASGMLEELDRTAKELNISRQAVIKTLIRQALDQQYLARGSRDSAKRK
jgi:hypothetical protein